MACPTSLVLKYDRPVPRYTSYPTSPHFKPMDEQDYRGWLRALPAGKAVSLYVHIPFCKKLCWYCGCHMLVTHSEQLMRDYVDDLLAEIRMLREAAGPRGQAALHFGGGSPSYLPPEVFKRIVEAIDEAFPRVNDTSERAIELDPRVTSPELIGLLGELGFNRVSLGVQTLNPQVQEAINRVQPYEMVADCVERVRAAGIKGINIDLMYGLPYQTPAGMEETIDLLMALRPDRFAVFGYAHVPHMKKHMELVARHPLPDGVARISLFTAAAERLAELGYVRIGLDHFALADDPMAIALKAGKLRRNFQGYTTDTEDIMLSVGVSAISQTPSGYVQNLLELKDYKAAVQAGKFPVGKGLGLTREDKARRDIIHTLMGGGVADIPHICGFYGIDLAGFDGVWPQLDALQADGLCRVDGHKVQVSEGRGQDLMRIVAACFDAYLGTGAAKHSRSV